jgi:hypothetical protein
MRQQTRRNTVLWTALRYIVIADSMKTAVAVGGAAGLSACLDLTDDPVPRPPRTYDCSSQRTRPESRPTNPSANVS